MSVKTILVTGGAGFIGSHVAQMLILKGYRPVIFDNLSTGSRESIESIPFIEGDLANLEDLNKVFTDFQIDAVMHFAASIDVGESVTDPAKYYTNNVANSLHLFETMKKHGVYHLIFSSTASIFGIPLQPHIDEDHPCNPMNPYGESKLMVEKILKHYATAYDFKYSILRYFNAAGGDPSGKIKYYKKKSSNLIPLILQSLKNPKIPLTIYGTDYKTPDGTCIRDYIHIDDLGSAHVLSLEKLFEDGQCSDYNLGNGNGFSVRDVIDATEKVTGLKVNVIEGKRREGDPAILIADSKKAHLELGFVPQYPDLKSIIEHAWQALAF